MKQVKDLDHLSYSSMSSYLMCPRAWKFHYLDEVETGASTALIFGSAFHNAVETFLAAKAKSVECDRPLPTLTECWRKAWEEQMAELNGDKSAFGFDNKTSEEALFNQGVTMLETPAVKTIVEELNAGAAKWPGEEYPSILIEKQFNLRVPGVPIPITGYIDMMADDGVPCDFKTSSKAWSHDKAMAESQPLFYLAALNQLGLTAHANRFRHIVFVKVKAPYCQVIETKRDFRDIFWMFKQVKEIWDAICNGAFPPNNTGWKCSPDYCEFTPICKRT